MYDREDRELALRALEKGMSCAAVASVVGCGEQTVRRWAAEGGVRARRKAPACLPRERKMELVARYVAGEHAADLAAEAGVTAPAVAAWARRLRERGCSYSFVNPRTGSLGRGATRKRPC